MDVIYIKIIIVVFIAVFVIFVFCGVFGKRKKLKNDGHASSIDPTDVYLGGGGDGN